MPIHGSNTDSRINENGPLPPKSGLNGRPFGAGLGLDTPDGPDRPGGQADERLFTVKVILLSSSLDCEQHR